VASQQNQVTVDYTAKTTFSQTITTTASAVKVGACVTATAVSPTGATPSAGPTASASRAPVTALTATEVTITAASGTCDAGGAFGNRTGAGGTQPTARPSGRARPSGAPGGAAGRGNFGGFADAAFGKVTSVSGDTFVVSETRGGTGGTSGTATNVTVTTTSATTYHQDATATSANLKVGLCATAIGAADDTGAVAATSIALSTAGANGCTTGFGGFGGRAGGGGANGGGSAG
jgi:hypothetical protein